jgi:hypothetical protein
VSHLSHLVPLLRNKKAAANSHHAVSHLSHPVPRYRSLCAMDSACATGDEWAFMRHSLAVSA